MNNYTITLNKLENCIDISLGKNIDPKKIRVLEDDNAIMLLDGYFINEEELIEKNSKIKEMQFDQLLFKLSKKDSEYYADLDGSYNIFYFDKKSGQFVFSNDSWSSRPTYIHKTKDKYYFANDICCLKKHIKTNLSPNLKKIKELIAWQFNECKSTYYNEIEKLEAGVILKINSNSVDKHVLNIFDNSKPIKKHTKEEFKKIFESAVSRRASQFKKIMVMLSGGLDSSAVAVALKNNGYIDVETISANFSHIKEFPNTNEMRYQDNVSAFTNFKKNHIEMKNKSIFKSIEKYIHIFHEPMLIPNLYIFESICENLAKNNVDAIFDGNDGDNVISYGFDGIYNHFKSLNFISFCSSVFNYAKIHKKSKSKMLVFFLKNSLKKLFGFKGKLKNNSLLQDSIFIEAGGNASKNILDSHETLLRNNLHFVAFESRHRIFSKLGVETVSPFYDKDLINFCVNMPATFKFYKGHTRYIQRDYLSYFLGEEHAFRENKADLSKGLVSNFSDYDYKIVINEKAKINKYLFEILDLDKLDSICNKWSQKKMITEQDIVNLQIFLNTNIFLNSFFK